MPVSLTTLGRPDARDGAPDVLPSTVGNASASQKYVVFEAQWLAYALPCRRFTPALADDGARLGADVVRYSFIVVDLHHLLLAALPAHTHPTIKPLQGSLPRRRPRLERGLQQLAAGRRFPVEHFAGGENAGQAADHEVGVEFIKDDSARARDRARDRGGAGEL